MSEGRHQRNTSQGDESRLQRLVLAAVAQALIREALEFIIQECVRHGGPS
jgi:hypothetical protein